MDKKNRQIWLDYWYELTSEDQAETAMELAQNETAYKSELQTRAQIIEDLQDKVVSLQEEIDSF